jgi:predicted Zn-dependent peptidase
MKPKLHKLKNGFPVVLVPQKGAGSMTLLVLCKVGSRYEPPEINGASHFIEHLMFKGTKRRPTTEVLSRELDSFGAEFNAYTDKDMTGYYIKMDAAKTALAVDMLHDMLFHSKYDPKEINRERGVIIEEINMYEDNPRMHVDDMLEEVLFPDSTLGWNIAGTRDIIRNVSRDQLIAYRDAYYVPERMAVIVSGKIVPGVMKLLEKTFGSVRRPLGRDVPFEPFKTPAKIKIPLAYKEKATEQVQYTFAFHGLKMTDPRLPAANLLSVILGASMSSRLFIQIRERRGLCYSIRAIHQAREDVGLFQVAAGLDKARFPEAVKAIFKELKDVAAKGVTAEELRRAKDFLRGQTVLAFEDSSFQAGWYGKDWLFRERLETPEQRMARFEKVTRGEVQKIAKELFRPERMAAAVIGPFGPKKNLEKIIKW